MTVCKKCQIILSQRDKISLIDTLLLALTT